MDERTKHINIDKEIKSAIEKCEDYREVRIFSFTVSYIAKDLLPILSGSKEKNSFRVYWKQNDPKIEMAGINQADNVCADNFSSMTDFNNEITAILDDGITNKNKINIGPKFIGGHTF